MQIDRRFDDYNCFSEPVVLNSEHVVLHIPLRTSLTVSVAKVALVAFIILVPVERGHPFGVSLYTRSTILVGGIGALVAW